MTSAASASAAVAAGLETTGAVSALTAAAADGSVSGAEVLGVVTLALIVVGATITGAAWTAPEIAAGAAGTGCGCVAEALEPAELAVACVLLLVAGLARCTVVGADTLGVVAADVDAVELEPLTVTLAGAVTTGAVTGGGLVLTGGGLVVTGAELVVTGGTCADAGMTSADESSTARVSDLPKGANDKDCPKMGNDHDGSEDFALEPSARLREWAKSPKGRASMCFKPLDERAFSVDGKRIGSTANRRTPQTGSFIPANN